MEAGRPPLSGGTVKDEGRVKRGGERPPYVFALLQYFGKVGRPMFLGRRG